MIECAFTYPAPVGMNYDAGHLADLELELIGYGGFTRFTAYGGWRNDDGIGVREAVYYYVVAVKGGTEVGTLYDLVADALRLAGEHSMFWRVDYGAAISIQVL